EHLASSRVRPDSSSFNPSSACRNCTCHGETCGVGDRNMPMLDSELACDFRTTTGELHDGTPSRFLLHLNLGQRDSPRQSRSHGFDHSFLAGEPTSVVFGNSF